MTMDNGVGISGVLINHKNLLWNKIHSWTSNGLLSPHKVISVAVLVLVVTILWVVNTDDIIIVHMQPPNHRLNYTLEKPNTLQVTMSLPAKYTYKVPNYEDKFKNPCFYNHLDALYCLPYAFILGMPKCGTTDLFRMLVKHPQVEETIKEPHWWTRRRFPKNRQYPSSLKTYLVTYVGFSKRILQYPDHILVDASASTLWDMAYWSKHINYTEHPGIEPSITTAHYVQQILPQSRFIVILRNPVDRLYSDYLYFNKHKTTTKYDFDAKVHDAVQQMTECVVQYGARSCVHNYTLKTKLQIRLMIGMYHIFLEDWFKVFPRDRFLILRLEDYHLERSKYLAKICKFLDIATYPEKKLQVLDGLPEQNSRHKVDTKKGGMLQETRNHLTKFYQSYNDKLGDLLNDTSYRWS